MAFHKNLLKGKIWAGKDTGECRNASNRAVLYAGNGLFLVAFAPPPPVVEAVGYVARLLNFQKPQASAYGMDCSRGNVDKIALLYAYIIKAVLYGICLYSLPKLACGVDSVQAANKACILICIKHIPALGLTACIFPLVKPCSCIVGVNLDAKLVVSLNHLYQKRIASPAELFKGILLSVGMGGSNPKLVTPYLV